MYGMAFPSPALIAGRMISNGLRQTQVGLQHQRKYCDRSPDGCRQTGRRTRRHCARSAGHSCRWDRPASSRLPPPTPSLTPPGIALGRWRRHLLSPRLQLAGPKLFRSRLFDLPGPTRPAANGAPGLLCRPCGGTPCHRATTVLFLGHFPVFSDRSVADSRFLDWPLRVSRSALPSGIWPFARRIVNSRHLDRLGILPQRTVLSPFFVAQHRLCLFRQPRFAVVSLARNVWHWLSWHLRCRRDLLLAP